MKSNPLKALAVVGAAGVLLAACGSQGSGTSAPASAPSLAPSSVPAKPSVSAVASAGASSAAPATSTSAAAKPSASAAASATTNDPTAGKAADFRVGLNNLLSQHIYITSMATDSAIEGSMDDFNAWAQADKDNGFTIGKALGSIYGADAEKSFNDTWQQHIGFFVDYTQAGAKNDAAGKQQALDNLNTVYTPKFVDFLNSATGLPKDALTAGTKEHIVTLSKVIDDQAAKNYTAELPDLRMAADHMQMLADTLAPAIVQKNADKLPGNPMTPPITLRKTLDNLLQQHVFLTGLATDAALEGNMDLFNAAAASDKQNGLDIGKALGGIYGADAEKSFNDTWQQHIGFFVDYTQAAGKNDTAAKQQATDNLNNVYTPKFVDFITGATGLPKDAVTSLTKEHTMTLSKAIDDQAAKNYTAEAPDFVMAGNHMDMIAGPLATAIVAKFPDKFGPASATGSSSPIASAAASAVAVLAQPAAAVPASPNSPAPAAAKPAAPSPASVAPTTPASPAAPAQPAPHQAGVSISGFAFAPAAVTVPRGSTVSWSNKDSVAHTVTATNNSFNSGEIAGGKGFSFTFANPGTYAYFCSIHTYMTGTVVVQ